MPRKYERIRDSLKSKGKSDSTAKRIAAATFNKNRGSKKPVTRKSK